MRELTWGEVADAYDKHYKDKARTKPMDDVWEAVSKLPGYAVNENEVLCLEDEE